MKPVYYNEIDPFAAAWLRELITAGHIAPGEVDERSIADVKPADLAGFGQCHFFAGIGGWSLALRLAGIGDDVPVWTGSCPCQPFSCAGKGAGTADERHLWPVFARLIAERRPVRVFGEQVASAIGHGWLDGVRADLEAEGYACGAVVLGAHSVGAPHIRQRLYWGAERVADRDGKRRDGQQVLLQQGGPQQARAEAAGYRNFGNPWSDSVWWPCRDNKWRRVPAFRGVDDAAGARFAPEGGGAVPGVERGGECLSGAGCEVGGWVSDAECARRTAAGGGFVEQAGGESEPGCGGVVCGPSGYGWMGAEPALFPLAARLPGRVGLLRGAGNAIVPQVAAEFVTAFMDAAR